VALDQPEHHETQDHHADLDDQHKPAHELEHRLAGGRRRTQTAGLARGYGNHEGREKPVADHHHHEHVVFPCEVARNAILHGKDEGRPEHQQDAEAGICPGHRVVSNRAAVMWRLRPNPGRRSTVNPAASSPRRTKPAAA